MALCFWVAARTYTFSLPPPALCLLHEALGRAQGIETRDLPSSQANTHEQDLPFLQTPPNQYLRRPLARLLAYTLQDRVVEAFRIGTDQRAVRLDGDIVCTAVSDDGVLLTPWVQLDLVYGWTGEREGFEVLDAAKSQLILCVGGLMGDEDDFGCGEAI